MNSFFVIVPLTTLASDIPFYVFEAAMKTKQLESQKWKRYEERMQEKDKLNDDNILFSNNWRRICIDEIQNLSNTNSKQVIACKQLQKVIGWGLTGTLFRSNVKQLTSIMQFIYGASHTYSQASYWIELCTPQKASHLERWRRNNWLARNEDNVPGLKQLMEPFGTEDIQQVITLSNYEFEQYRKHKEEAKKVYEQIQSSSSTEKTQNENIFRVKLLHLIELCNDPVLVEGKSIFFKF
jgi:hypothetical protein